MKKKRRVTYEQIAQSEPLDENNVRILCFRGIPLWRVLWSRPSGDSTKLHDNFRRLSIQWAHESWSPYSKHHLILNINVDWALLQDKCEHALPNRVVHFPIATLGSVILRSVFLWPDRFSLVYFRYGVCGHPSIKTIVVQIIVSKTICFLAEGWISETPRCLISIASLVAINHFLAWFHGVNELELGRDLFFPLKNGSNLN